ncbi:MAG: hypothetical protein IH623_30720 [Verrucomicrobia bacterium]|nr:hypothetical protein [Verrucomicrobiota bacterium]
MNQAQTQLYFRTWAAAAKAHGWDSIAGVTAAVARHKNGDVWQSPELNQTLSIIYTAAQNYALQSARSITANDLRHGCHFVALGRSVSSKRFTNGDFDRVLGLLRLLTDPTNLRNVLAFQDNGQAGERKRQLHVIHQSPPAYVARIANDKFGHSRIDDLTLEQLRQLALTLRHRRPGAPVSDPARTNPAATNHPELAAA